MIKLFSPESWNLFENTTLIKLSSKGIVGADQQKLVKYASAGFVELAKKAQLEPGEIPVAFLAMGATESSGPNRNGDGFRYHVLQKYADTFRTHARYYRHHKNKDPKKSYGTVKLAYVNPEMKRVELLVALNGTKAAAERNGGLVADEEQEKLASGQDLACSMACLTNKNYPILTRDRGYVPISQVTENDFVYTKQGRWRRVTAVRRRVYTGRVYKFKINSLPFPIELTADHPMWAKVFAGSRQASAMQVKSQRYFNNPDAFENEPADWLKAEELGIGDRFFYRTVTDYPGYGVIACEKLAATLGHRCVLPELFNSESRVKLSFLGSWLDGDGWVDKKGAHWSTASKNLVLQGRDLLMSLGIAPSIYRIDHRKCRTSGYRGSGVEYVLNISHRDVWQLAEWSSKVAAYPIPPTPKRPGYNYRACPDGTFALRISGVRSREVVDCQTYNIEVDEDESYSAAGLISHNCSVDFDKCIACGNEAPTRAQYCKSAEEGGNCTRFGCTTGLTKVADDGFMQYVDNPHPTFFDISGVTRPADRIAYGAVADYLEKAASHGIVLGGAALAELHGVTAPLSINLYGITDARLAQQIKLAHKLADIEETLESKQMPSAQDYGIARAFSHSVQPPLDITPFDKVGSAAFSRCLRALATYKVAMPLRDFLRLLVGGDSAKSAAASAVVAGYLPGVYSRMVASTNLAERLQSNPFMPSREQAPANLRKWAAEYAETHSVAPEMVQLRSSLHAIRNMELPLVQLRQVGKVASELGEAERLAQLYALYKLAFLSEVLSDDANSELTAELAIRQNYVS